MLRLNTWRHLDERARFSSGALARRLGLPQAWDLRTPNPALARVEPLGADQGFFWLRPLASRGAPIEEAVLPKLKRSVDIWVAMMSANNEISFGEMLGEGRRGEAVRSLARWALRRSPHTLPALALVAVEKVVAQLPKKRAAMLALCTELRDELVGLLGPHGIMLFPRTPPSPRCTVAPCFCPFIGCIGVLSIFCRCLPPQCPWASTGPAFPWGFKS